MSFFYVKIISLIATLATVATAAPVVVHGTKAKQQSNEEAVETPKPSQKSDDQDLLKEKAETLSTFDKKEHELLEQEKKAKTAYETAKSEFDSKYQQLLTKNNEIQKKNEEKQRSLSRKLFVNQQHSSVQYKTSLANKDYTDQQSKYESSKKSLEGLEASLKKHEGILKNVLEIIQIFDKHDNEADEKEESGEETTQPKCAKATSNFGSTLTSTTVRRRRAAVEQEPQAEQPEEEEKETSALGDIKQQFPNLDLTKFECKDGGTESEYVTKLEKKIEEIKVQIKTAQGTNFQNFLSSGFSYAKWKALEGITAILSVVKNSFENGESTTNNQDETNELSTEVTQKQNTMNEKLSAYNKVQQDLQKLKVSKKEAI